MRNNYRVVDIGLLVAALLFLFLPLFQNTLHLKKNIPGLKGAYKEEIDTAFTWKGWFNGSFQEKKQAYLNQNFGFRNYYVRLNNQFDFTLFHKINTEHVVVGKADVFFEDDYINAYYGKNFQGKEKLEALANKLKLAQQILKSNNIRLEILYLPGKASYFPEYIPDGYKTRKSLSNYEHLSAHSTKIGLDFIDYNAWFKKLKPTSIYDLYPAGGIHWSNYGALLAFDSLRKHIELNTFFTLREFKINRVNFSQNLQNPDNDIAEALNLWRDIKPLSMPYAQYTWLQKKDESKPRALFVGDSYFWNWYYQGLINNFFTGAQFWYYNQTVYPDTLPVREVKALPFKETVSANQVIVLMATESNIHDIGWGFADQVISSFKLNDAPKSTEKPILTQELIRRKEIYLRYFVNEIRNTPVWLDKIKLKSSEKNISLDSMLILDADYLYETEYANKSVIDHTNQTIERIRKDAAWMKQIRAKAKEKKIPDEEMLELDAKYLYDQEVKRKK